MNDVERLAERLNKLSQLYKEISDKILELISEINKISDYKIELYKD